MNLQDHALRVMGKGSRERDIPIPERLRPRLVNWRARDGHGAGWVFPSSQRIGQHMSPTMLWRDVKDSAIVAGVERRVTPHVLRHTFATELLRQGVDIRVVQELLGHASLKNTQIYVGVLPARLLADIGRLNFDAPEADEQAV